MFPMTLSLSCTTLILSLAGSTLLFAGSPADSTVNQGGPPIVKRNYTQQEIQQTLQAFGITPQTSSPISCYITDSTGLTVTQIAPSAYPSGPFYWMHYVSGGVSSAEVAFVVLPLFTGSPLVGPKQNFTPNSSTNIETPFGIPFWGSNLTSGPWMLVVQDSANQRASCMFTVM